MEVSQLRQRDALTTEKSSLRDESTTASPENGNPDSRSPPLSYWDSIRGIVVFSWTNLFLVFVPIGWICYSLELGVIVIVVTNFLATAALSNLLNFSFSQLALTFDGAFPAVVAIIYEVQMNFTEVIFSIIALTRCELQTLQAVLMGAVVKSLPVIGFCVLTGGFKYFEQGFNMGHAQINCSFLMLGVTIQLLPGIVSYATAGESRLALPYDPTSIARTSRFIAVFTIVSYCFYWLFRYSYSRMSEHPDPKIQKYMEEAKQESTEYPSEHSPKQWIYRVTGRKKGSEGAKKDKKPQDRINPVLGVIVLVGCGVLIVYTIDHLWSALDVLTEQGSISPEFAGVIWLEYKPNSSLIPLVSEIAQADVLVASIQDSVDDRLDDMFENVIGSSIQMALLITPLMVVIGWIMGLPLFLINDPVDSFILFMSVLVLNYVINDGKSNWFEGIVLLTLYVVLAVTLWHYPGRDLFMVLASEGIAIPPSVCEVDGTPINQ